MNIREGISVYDRGVKLSKWNFERKLHKPGAKDITTC